MAEYDVGDLAYLKALRAQSAPEAQGHGEYAVGLVHDAPKNVIYALRGMGQGAWNMLTEKPDILRQEEAQQQAAEKPDFLYSSDAVRPPRDFLGTMEKVVGEDVLPELPGLMIGGGAVGKVGRLAGLGETGASIVGSMGAGAVAGAQQGGQESVIQAGEFGAMDAVGALFPKARPLFRAAIKGATGAAIPIADQAIRGNDPFTEQNLAQSTTMGLFPFAMEGRKLFRRGPEAPAPEGPALDNRTELPPGWRLLDRTETPEGKFKHVMEAPDRSIHESVDEHPIEGETGAFPGLKEGDLNTAPQAEGDVFANVERKPISVEPQSEAPVDATTEAPQAPANRLRPLNPSESGAINTPLLHTLAGGSLGAAVGYALPGTDEEKRQRAAIWGVLGAGVMGGRKLFKTLGGEEGERLARQQLVGIGGGKTVKGFLRRTGEKYMKVGQSPALDIAKEQARGSVTRIEQDIAGDFKTALPDLGTLDPTQQRALRTFMSSDRGAGAQARFQAHGLPKTVEDFALKTTRNKADLQQIIADAEADPQKKALIRSTLGNYVTEPYRAFVNPKEWQKQGVNPKLTERLVQLNRRDPRFAGFTEDKIRQDVSEWIKEVNNFGGDWDRYANEGTSRMSKSLFTPKKQLRPIVKRILGNIRDPIEREVLTVAKLVRSGVTAKLVSELQQPHAVDEAGRKLTMPTHEWEAALASARARGDTAAEKFLQSNYEVVPPTLTGLGSLASGPKILKGGKQVDAGMMAQRQVMDAMQAGSGHGQMNWDKHIFAILNRIPKAAHTLYNPATHIHNIVQAPLQAVAAGMLPHTFVGNIRRLWANPTRLKWAKEDGILDAHMGAGEFRRAADNFEKVLNPGKFSFLGKIHEAVKGLYGLPDQWARGAAYNKFLDEGLAKGKSNPEARRYAVEMTNRYTQNYSNVAPAVGLARNVPFINPFISYSAEMLRIIKNLASDVVTNANGRRHQSAAALVTFLGLGAGIKALIQSSTMSDEDREKLDKLIPILPPYMHGRTQAQVARDPKSGTTSFFNLNPWLPAEDFVQTAKNIMNGDWDALKATNPVMGMDRSPIMNIIEETRTGKDTVTGQPSGFMQSVQENFLPGWFPGVPGVTKPNYAAQKLVQGFTRNNEGGLGVTDASGRFVSPKSAVAGLFGLSLPQANPRQLLRRAKFEQQDAIRQAKSDLRRVLSTDTNDEAKAEARGEFHEKVRRIFKR